MSVVDNAVYIDGRRSVEPESLNHTYEVLRECPAGGRSFCWIGLLRPDADEIASVAREFGLHSLAVEDAVHAHQRPKLERYGETFFVVLRPARYVDPVEVVELSEVHLFIGPDFVITVRHADEPNLAEIRKRLEQEPELLKHGPLAVLYSVLDRVVDDYEPVLLGLGGDIDEIETQVFDGDPSASKRIYTLSREVIEFQRAVEPLREIFEQLRERADDELMDVELARSFRDVEDHATRVLERTESFRQLLMNVLTANAALVGQRQNDHITQLSEMSYNQNEQVKRISAWAAILFAPSLVGTVYGMNFDNIPELGWQFGYPFALALMVIFSAVLYMVFKRRGWL